MASEITVQTIKGPTSGANANKVIIPSGQTLDTSSGAIIHPADGVVKSTIWEVPATSVSTDGSWSVSTTPTMPNTYTVADFTLTKKYSSSHVICIANGHVDVTNVGGGSPTIVALFEANAGGLIGSGYRHLRYNNDEPFAYAFSGIDTTTGTSKTYRLKCHCSGGPMHFSRTANGNNGHSVFTVTFLEIAQ
jgi:hypothetical protein